MIRHQLIFLLTVCLIVTGLLNSTPVSAQHSDLLVFTQLVYEGNWDPYPETWQDIVAFLLTTTSIQPQRQRRTLKITDPELFSSPFLMILGSGEFPRFTDEERLILRRYVSNGGLIFVEDSSGMRGSRFDEGFRREIAAVFPELPLRRLPGDHPLYRAYYLLRKVGGRLNMPYLEGVDITNRTVLVYSTNDIIGAWAKDRFGNYLWECPPGGQAQRFEAQKLTLNLIMYLVTGTYKSDAIHQPFLKQKLRQ